MLGLRSVVAIFTALFVAVDVNVAFADPVRPASGPVILTRAGAEASYTWDSSTYVAQLVNEKVPVAEGLRALEASALSALASKAKTAKATTVSIKVVYSRTGAVSPVYKVATFAGIEKVCTITVRRSDLMKDADSWSSSLAAGTVPAQVKIDVTGRLPEPQ